MGCSKIINLCSAHSKESRALMQIMNNETWILQASLISKWVFPVIRNMQAEQIQQAPLSTAHCVPVATLLLV